MGEIGVGVHLAPYTAVKINTRTGKQQILETKMARVQVPL
jgi:hypothetical protein